MNVNDWVQRNREKFGSDYEILFATSVLPLVQDLVLDSVSVQYPFRDKDGRQRYCDFTILESDSVRVAIEIDGYDKRGNGSGMSHADFLDWQRRQASLASYGWHVLRFANRDVRDNPRRCAEHISDLLRRLRRSEGGRVEVVRIEAPLQVVDVSHRPQQAQSSSPTGTSAMRVFVGGLAVAALLGGIALFTSYGRGSDGSARVLTHEVAPTQPARVKLVASEHAYGGLTCSNPIDWTQARKYIGQTVEVRGPLVATTKRPEVNGSPLWLDLGEAYPSNKRLNIVIWGRHLPNFELRHLDADAWHASSGGRRYATVCVRGLVQEYRGVAQIVLEDATQVRVF